MISLYLVILTSYFWEEIKEKTPESSISFLSNVTAWRKRTFSSLDSFRPRCPGLEELKTPSFIWLWMLFLWCVGDSRTHSELRQALWGQVSPLEGKLPGTMDPSLLPHPRPVDSTFQSWENRKLFCLRPPASHWASLGSGRLHCEMRGTGLDGV